MAQDKVEAYPFKSTRIKDAAERNVTKSIVDAFQDSFDEVADDVVDAYEKQTEASKIVEMLDFDSYDQIADDVQNSLEAVFGESSEDAIDEVYKFVDDDIKRDDAFDLANKDAEEYAADRGAEMVGKKWVNGKLIDNPDAQWVITDTTRDGIQSLIERAYDQGMTPAQVRDELRDSYGFSKERAQMIAKTEMTKASTQGSLAGWKHTGVVEGKEWIVGDDWSDSFDCDCGDNGDAGVIALDETFPSGDDGPPNHPNCNCSMAAILIPEGEEDPDAE